MGDKRRFNVLADFLAEHIPPEAKIADVAAGKGHLSLALKERGFSNLVAWEPNPRRFGQIRGVPLRVQPFTMDEAKAFDVIVGMHPDGATEEIVCGTARHEKRMFLVPCCAITSRTVMWTVNNWKGWIDHLLRLCHRNGLNPKRKALPMSGRNVLLWV